MIKSAEQAFTQSFIKQAMANGLSEAQATKLFKTAAEKHANDWMAQLQPYLQKAQDFASQNPAAAGAIGGGLGGMAVGAGAAGKGNRLKGALGGGLAGAGLGGAGGLAIDPSLRQRLFGDNVNTQINSGLARMRGESNANPDNPQDWGTGGI